MAGTVLFIYGELEALFDPNTTTVTETIFSISGLGGDAQDPNDPNYVDPGIPSYKCIEKEIEKAAIEDKTDKKLTIKVSSKNLPHAEKRYRGGEDAIYTSDDGHLLVVADGVGGWNLQGIDPSLYSRTLVQGVKEAYERGNRQPLHLMCSGQSKALGILGSSTLVVASIVGNKLHVGNLGDSGLVVIRDQKVIYQTTDMHHSFNYPFQLGASGDGLDQAELKQIEIKVGDTILLASDGLFDNLFLNTIIDMIFDRYETQDKASYLASLAEVVGWRSDIVSPFQTKAAAEGLLFRGGKADDISVIIATVVA